MISTSVDGANSNASLYSLVETTKANELKLYAYLMKVLSELTESPAAKTLEDFER